MSNILLIRDKAHKHKLHNNQLLMEHQAVLAVTRSILASSSPEGMRFSGHKLIVPNHIDLLPLFALVADDYAEFVEPEPDKPVASAPITLYWDIDKNESENEQVVTQFLHPRWFHIDGERPSLAQIIDRYRPDTCVFFGRNEDSLSELSQLKYRFRQIIGFSMFMPERDDNNLRNFTEQVIMADQVFDQAVISAMRKMEMPYERLEQASSWYNMYRDDEKRPELEPFVAFGAAFEMTMFLPPTIQFEVI